MSETSRPPDYKGLIYPQLRSFCEVAQRGSMAAAARALGVAQPTVWKQVRALEKTLGTVLLESHRRGCTPTEAGRLLLTLCGPAVGEIEGLSERFAAELGRRRRRLTVVGSPRQCVEDLPPCLDAFAGRFPDVQLTVREVSNQRIVEPVREGEADLALIDPRWIAFPKELESQPCYTIDPILVLPVGHALAEVASISVRDLAAHPLVNARDSYPNHIIAGILRHEHAYDHPERVLELVTAQSVYHYVRLGFGIGLVAHPTNLVGHLDQAGLVERSLVGAFGRFEVHAVTRRRARPDSAIDGLLAILSETLGRLDLLEGSPDTSVR